MTPRNVMEIEKRARLARLYRGRYAKDPEKYRAK